MITCIHVWAQKVFQFQKEFIVISSKLGNGISRCSNRGKYAERMIERDGESSARERQRKREREKEKESDRRRERESEKRKKGREKRERT